MAVVAMYQVTAKTFEFASGKSGMGNLVITRNMDLAENDHLYWSTVYKKMRNCNIWGGGMFSYKNRICQ